MTRHLLPAVVALLLLTAGCAGLDGAGTPTDSTTPTQTTPTDATTSTQTTSASDDLPAASAVKADALDTARAVEAYRVSATSNRTRTIYRTETGSDDWTPPETEDASNWTKTVNGTETGIFYRSYQTNKTLRAAFDRPNQRLRSNLTVLRAVFDRPNQRLRSNETDRRYSTLMSNRYIVDSTIYRYSTSGPDESEWSILSTKFNSTHFYNLYDTLGTQETLLNASDVTVTGTATVGDVETYVLQADASDAGVVPGGVREIGGPIHASHPDVTIEGGQFRFYVATDSGRLVKSDIDTNVTIDSDGATIREDTTMTFRFHYDADVVITLPPKAEDAVSNES